MREGQPSRTAERVAVERAAHQVIDSPRVFEDPLAVRIIDPAEAARLREHPQRHDASPIAKPTRAFVVVRSRIAEAELARAAATGVTQYVLLGAGLDTFAYRNPFPSVRVFEVDHPRMQQLKRQRLAGAEIPIPPNVTFVPCDFERQRIADALDAAGFDRRKPAVFAWLGVAMYLEPDDVMRTLADVASMPAGASIIFDYALPPKALPWLGRIFYRRVLKRLEEQGEPWKSFFEPAPLRVALLDLGFTEVEDAGAETINARELGGRTDGLKARGVGRIVVARK